MSVAVSTFTISFLLPAVSTGSFTFPKSTLVAYTKRMSTETKKKLRTQIQVCVEEEQGTDLGQNIA